MVYRCVLFLRGMNLGGRRITNEGLLAVLADLGHPDATAYQASGNVLLATHPTPDPDALAADLSEALGYDVPCLLRSAARMREIAAWEPFTPEQVARAGKAQLILLSAPATPADAVAFSAGLDDQLVVRDGGLELAWLPSAGVSDSSLDLVALNRTFGPTTVRTMGTMHRLAAKLEAPG